MNFNLFDIDRPFGPRRLMYNVPYGDGYSSVYNYDQHNDYDIPKQTNLNKKYHLCGYVEIDGTYHKCDSCQHEKIIREIIYNNEDFRNRYFETPASFFDRIPKGMLQEEYFAMKCLGFVKISSFKDTPNDMIVFFYDNLTYKQSDIIYPR